MSTKRKAGSRPPVRMIQVKLDAPFEGWEAECRGDFPARILADLGSGDLDRVGEALDRLVVDHNFPDEKDEIAATMLEVDPFEAITMLATKITEGLAALPPR